MIAGDRCQPAISCAAKGNPESLRQFRPGGYFQEGFHLNPAGNVVMDQHFSQRNMAGNNFLLHFDRDGGQIETDDSQLHRLPVIRTSQKNLPAIDICCVPCRKYLNSDRRVMVLFRHEGHVRLMGEQLVIEGRDARSRDRLDMFDQCPRSGEKMYEFHQLGMQIHESARPAQNRGSHGKRVSLNNSCC